MSFVTALVAAATIWHPAPGTTYQIQLQGSVDRTIPASVYEIDGFDNSASTVAALHSAGRKAVCYVSAGSWENWRPDAAQFPKAVLGKNLAGWPGERWLDIRRIDVLLPLLQARFQMCAAKGFDAVEADNVDSYTNATGFRLTYADQLAYDTALARAAHGLGLAIGLKNDGGQVGDLVSSFDFAVDEQCFAYDECGLYTPFAAAGKAVFDIEYGGTPAKYCPKAALGLTAIKKHLDLGAWRQAC